MIISLINESKQTPEEIDSITTNNGEIILIGKSITLSIRVTTKLLGLHYNTYTNWIKQEQDMRDGAPHPGNENYTEEEHKAAIEALYKYPDLSPYELQAKYLDEFGIYLGSVRWLYYLLEDIKNRKPQIKGPKTKGPCNLSRQTCTATGVNQVWCWDITYLYSPVIGQYYYLYSIMDLYSRYIVHFEVHDTQSDKIAAECIRNAVNKQKDSLIGANVNLHGINMTSNGSQLILHSDNGGPMKGQTMQAACYSLGILCTFNRPRTSNDNAHMEASFKLLKHGRVIEIPSYFHSIEHARVWCKGYYDWYNKEHRHSGICYVTPALCFEGKGSEIMEKRNRIIADFYRRHKTLDIKRNNAGGNRATKKAFIWKMPDKAEVMPFYTKRNKVTKGIKNAGYNGIKQE